MRLALAALVLGLALGAAGALWIRPARVEVRVRDLTAAERDALRTVVTVAGPERTTAGAVRVVERWRTAAGPTPAPAPGCAPCPACEEHERVEERGPVTTDRGPVTTTDTQQVREVVRVERVTVEAPRAVWAVGAGLQLLPDQRAELGLERRLLGPVWVRGWVLARPALEVPAAGLGLRVEW